MTVMRPASTRRHFMAAAFALLAGAARPLRAASQHPDRAWYLDARRMRALAESWGDQRYGAVVVAGGRVIGHGPSRVVRDNDPDAHAERVAIRDALRARPDGRLQDAVLYSTSRPCSACEQAAARAGILRMYFGEELQDGGKPAAG